MIGNTSVVWGSGGFTRPYEMKPLKNGPKGQLYNLRTDSMELNNLYLPEPAKVKELTSEIEKLKAQGYSRPQ